MLAGKSVKTSLIVGFDEANEPDEERTGERTLAKEKKTTSFGIIFSASFPRNFGMRKESYVARFADRLSERWRKEKGRNGVCAYTLSIW